MKQIPLSQNKYALVDDEDYDFLNQWKWSAFKNHDGTTFYAYRNPTIETNKRKIIFMHNLILHLEDGQQPDHIDGNGLNNQKHNLRIVTSTQNMQNKPLYKNNKSGYKGVYLKRSLKSSKPWQAYIRVNKKLIYLGYYATAVEAAVAYDQAAKLHFGEFARLNFAELK